MAEYKEQQMDSSASDEEKLYADKPLALPVAIAPDDHPDEP
jgi:hypothetical protein